MNLFHYFAANSFDVYFTAHREIIDHAVYLGALQKGATWILVEATWFLPADCPMGNLNILGVVKAYSSSLRRRIFFPSDNIVAADYFSQNSNEAFMVKM